MSGVSECPVLAPTGLAEYDAFHNCLLFVFGTLGNGCVLWCVRQCPKTPLPLKLMLASIYLPVAIICFFSTLPLVVFVIAKYKLCWEINSVIWHSTNISVMVYSAMAQVEIFSITAMATFRVFAVWSSTKFELTMDQLKWILPSLWLSSILESQIVIGIDVYEVVDIPMLLSVIYYLPTVMLPLLYTLACYIAVFIKMRQHQQELNSMAASITSSVSAQASRLVLMVFISNFMFGLPHAVFHVIPNPSIEVSFIVHIIYSIHFIVDPVVFFVFSENYRKVLWGQLKCLSISGTKCSSTENSTKESNI
ncbi:unnamed protein product, partial [Meganyctiphanes norvegica]